MQSLNNLRIQGLPEATGPENLQAAILDTDAPASLEFNRVHRVLGPKPPEYDRPRDVICRLHRYTQKDQIIRAAWSKGQIDFDGIARRAMLKHLLEPLHRAALPYRWEFTLPSDRQQKQCIIHPKTSLGSSGPVRLSTYIAYTSPRLAGPTTYQGLQAILLGHPDQAYPAAPPDVGEEIRRRQGCRILKCEALAATNVSETCLGLHRAGLRHGSWTYPAFDTLLRGEAW